MHNILMLLDYMIARNSSMGQKKRYQPQLILNGMDIAVHNHAFSL